MQGDFPLLSAKWRVDDGSDVTLTASRKQKYQDAIVHLKFVVVDGEAIEAGSFKFTAGAERKDAENVLALHDPAVARQHARDWDRLWADSEELQARY